MPRMYQKCNECVKDATLLLEEYQVVLSPKFAQEINGEQEILVVQSHIRSP
jgi:hypothetical protein